MYFRRAYVFGTVEPRVWPGNVVRYFDSFVRARVHSPENPSGYLLRAYTRAVQQGGGQIVVAIFEWALLGGRFQLKTDFA